jgi:hypothetical protein
VLGPGDVRGCESGTDPSFRLASSLRSSVRHDARGRDRDRARRFELEPSGLTGAGIIITAAATFDGAYGDGFSGKCLLNVRPDPQTGRYTFSKP